MSEGRTFGRTSGTTGRVKRFAISRSLAKTRADLLATTRGEGFADLKSLLIGFGRTTAEKYRAYMEGKGGKAYDAANTIPAVVKQVLTFKPDGIIGMPGWLLAVSRELRGRHKFKYIMAGGTKIDAATAGEIRASMGTNLWSTYSTTEAGTIAMADAQDIAAGITGRIVPGVEVKITPAGEIAVKTPTMVSEYDDGRGGKKGMLIDGWFHTGDIGRLTGDGGIVVTGRIARIVRPKG